MRSRTLSAAEVAGTAPLAKAVLLKTASASYVVERVVGSGSFGVVLAGRWQETGAAIALKRVLQDRRYKNRELHIMRALSHPCVVRLLDSFYSPGVRSDEIFLNVVMEYLPSTLYDVSRTYFRRRTLFPTVLTKVFVFQLCRALAYLHGVGVCHRDIKPQNLLCNPATGELRVCDFGSAKLLRAGEPNVSYICSRFYRAPELIFGATDYTGAIDVWAMACVMAELYLGRPLFAGDTSTNQLLEIMRVLGTPTPADVAAMNRAYPAGAALPSLRRTPWSRVFRVSPEPHALALLTSVLVYAPQQRPSAAQLLAHPWFADLPGRAVKLPSGAPLPRTLFDYSKEELTQAASLGITPRLPSYAHAHAPHHGHAHARQRAHAPKHAGEPQLAPVLAGSSCAAAAAAETAAAPAKTTATAPEQPAQVVEAGCPQGVSGA